MSEPRHEQKYPTIRGFYGRDLWLGLVENKQNEEVVLFKFMLGQRKGPNLVQWLAVVVQGKAAEKFLALLPELTARDTLSLRGIYQTRPGKHGGHERREFWAFSVKKVEREQ